MKLGGHMVYDFLATSQEEKDLILSEKKTAQVFFHDLCGKEFKAGDKFVLLFPQDEAFGIVEINEVRMCRFSDVNLDAEWLLTGFTTFQQVCDYGYANHPNFQNDVTVVFVRWGEILAPEKIKWGITTRLDSIEKYLRARDDVRKMRQRKSWPGE